MVQCVIIFIASCTILKCVWHPNLASFDYYKLASIMYLYDKKACGSIVEIKNVVNLKFHTDTKGLKVLPIPWEPPVETVSTQLSAKTRNYVSISMGVHVIWMNLAIALRGIVKSNRHPRLLKFILSIFFYSCVFVILFDLSMGIVYVAHIKQSLTKGMIIRYSGWGVLLKLGDEEDFAGWLPMIASACWLRGVFFFAMNVYCCSILKKFRNKIWKIEFRKRYTNKGNLPIPEPIYERSVEENVLYYRPGNIEPYANKSF